MKCSECHKTIRDVVAVDIDGTLAQYHRAYAEFAEAYLGLEPRTLPRRWDGIGEFADRLGLTKHQHHNMKVAFRAGGFKRWMPKFDNAVWLMNKLKSLKVEVWVTTTRPWMRMDNVDVDTQEWLRRWEIPYDGLLFHEDKYARLMELVDPERIVAILDDEQEQEDRCRELSLPFTLRSSEWNYGLTNECMISDLQDFAPIVEERLGWRDALQH